MECREYKKTHPVVRRRGAKIITFTGDEEFLDRLHSFPSNFPFSIKIANAYIRGGDRVKERYAGGKSQRPKISQRALRDLLQRNSKMRADAAAEAEDLRRTDLHSIVANPVPNKLTLIPFFTLQADLCNRWRSVTNTRVPFIVIFMYRLAVPYRRPSPASTDDKTLAGKFLIPPMSTKRKRTDATRSPGYPPLKLILTCL